MATHSSILTWRILMDSEAWWVTATNTFYADVNGNVCLHVYSGGPPVGPLKMTKFTCVKTSSYLNL